MALHWSEKQLNAYQKRKGMRENSTRQLKNTENHVRVHGVIKDSIQENTERNTALEKNVILNCEIGAIPPSVNHYWVKSGRGFKLSDRARDFHDLVALIVPQLNTPSRLGLDVTFHFQNKQKRDIDNFLKATIDSLVKCGLCEDDEQFDQLVVRRGEVVKGGLIKIKVWEM